MPHFDIHTGFWIEWTHGRVLGSSITLTTRSSNVLIAVAGLWAGNLIAGWVWSIFASLVYRFRNGTTNRDGVHIQHQLVWRNVGDPLSAASENFKIWRATRRQLKRSGTHQQSISQAGNVAQVVQSAPATPNHKFQHIHRRTCWTLAVPLAIWAGFIVVGVILSFLASSKHDVLVASSLNACGIWDFTPKGRNGSRSQSDVQSAYSRKVLNDTLTARNYARSCYSGDLGTVNSASCSFFTKQKLLYEPHVHLHSCPFRYYLDEPFQDGACDAPLSNGYYAMKTALLDSSIDLGSNAPAKDAIGFQKVVNCSVLSLNNRTSTMKKGFSTKLNTIYTTYLFGTFQDSIGINVTDYIDAAASQSNNVPYQVKAVYSNAGVPGQDWAPSPPFDLANGDVSLFFLDANSVNYENKVFDPYFWAVDPLDMPLGFTSASRVFAPVNPVSVVGCVDQYVICTSSRSSTQCTQPGGIYALPSEVERLQLNTAQSVTAKRLIAIFKNTDTYSSVYGTGTSALKASDTVLGVMSFGLPPNQWEIEVEGWFQTSMAKMQAYAVEFATNSGSLGVYGTVTFPDADGNSLSTWQAQCRSQRVANPGQYQTFSLLGLMILFCAGIVLLCAGQLIGCWVANGSDPAYAADDKFQLQRMVLGSPMLSQGNEFPVYDPDAGLIRTAMTVDGFATYLPRPKPVSQSPAPSPALQTPAAASQGASVASGSTSPPAATIPTTSALPTTAPTSQANPVVTQPNALQVALTGPLSQSNTLSTPSNAPPSPPTSTASQNVSNTASPGPPTASHGGTVQATPSQPDVLNQYVP